MEFKSVLKELREARHISQAKLAEMLEITPGAVGMYESGKRQPSYEMLCEIADLFNVNIDYLIGREMVSAYLLKPEDAELAKILSKNAKLKILMDKANNLTEEQVDKIIAFIELIK